MSLIPGICTQCGATLSVEKNKDIIICPYCNTPFLAEKAIQVFNNTYNIINNITTQNVIVQENINKNFDIVGGVLRKYNGSDIDVIIPDNVIAIGEYAFKDTKIKSVIMPNSVTEIRWNAFYSCDILEDIILSNTLKLICSSAFSNAIKLKIHLPDSVESIGGGAFSGIDSIYLSSYLLNKIDNPRAWYRAKEIYIDSKKLTVYDLKNNQLLRQKLCESRIGIELEKEEKEEQNKKAVWRNAVCCQYCGGSFSGFFTLKCKQCGRVKDY